MSAGDSAVGIECTDRVVRGVLLDEHGQLPSHAAEVSLRSTRDDRAVLDAFVRLRAELGGPRAVARIALFPAGSSMHRIDVTGRSGPELNTERSDIARRLGISSTLLVDAGPRRWLYALAWPVERVRRFEALAERAGFIDVAVEPSPTAIARAIPPAARYVERTSAANEQFAAVFEDGAPISAVASSPVGAEHPVLAIGEQSFSIPMFDGLTDGEAIGAQLLVVQATQSSLTSMTRDPERSLLVDGAAYPSFPPHDLRGPERQCVALGAAIGAAGIGGPHRPVDIISASMTDAPLARRPWTIERVSSLSAPEPVAVPGATKRALARLRPHRR